MVLLLAARRTKSICTYRREHMEHKLEIIRSPMKAERWLADSVSRHYVMLKIVRAAIIFAATK